MIKNAEEFAALFAETGLTARELEDTLAMVADDGAEVGSVTIVLIGYDCPLRAPVLLAMGAEPDGDRADVYGAMLTGDVLVLLQNCPTEDMATRDVICARLARSVPGCVPVFIAQGTSIRLEWAEYVRDESPAAAN